MSTGGTGATAQTFPAPPFIEKGGRAALFLATLSAWDKFGAPSRCESLGSVPVFINQFWTSKQRAASSLHEISYRACFKPALPAFFIDHLSHRGEVVYDPFMGRGTTLIEAHLRGRIPYGSDINPLSRALCLPRFYPPGQDQVVARLASFDLTALSPEASEPAGEMEQDLLAFYHPSTLEQILALRHILLARQEDGALDLVDRWIAMVATNRLSGHSPGFFSVYTMPPNQAVSAASQRRINQRRDQTPPLRDVAALIARKSRSLLRKVPKITESGSHDLHSAPRLFTASADHTPDIGSDSISLIVTSPPFLDTVDYAGDNWLRCWFNGIDPASLGISVISCLQGWTEFVRACLAEFSRVLEPGGVLCFEVGEVRNGRVNLEESVLLAAQDLPLSPLCVAVNAQDFTKTSNCWGVSNNRRGTNSNRIVVFQKI